MTRSKTLMILVAVYLFFCQCNHFPSYINCEVTTILTYLDTSNVKIVFTCDKDTLPMPDSYSDTSNKYSSYTYWNRNVDNLIRKVVSCNCVINDTGFTGTFFLDSFVVEEDKRYLFDVIVASNSSELNKVTWMRNNYIIKRIPLNILNNGSYDTLYVFKWVESTDQP